MAPELSCASTIEEISASATEPPMAIATCEPMPIAAAAPTETVTMPLASRAAIARPAERPAALSSSAVLFELRLTVTPEPTCARISRSTTDFARLNPTATIFEPPMAAATLTICAEAPVVLEASWLPELSLA